MAAAPAYIDCVSVPTRTYARPLPTAQANFARRKVKGYAYVAKATVVQCSTNESVFRARKKTHQRSTQGRSHVSGQEPGIRCSLTRNTHFSSSCSSFFALRFWLCLTILARWGPAPLWHGAFAAMGSTLCLGVVGTGIKSNETRNGAACSPHAKGVKEVKDGFRSCLRCDSLDYNTIHNASAHAVALSRKGSEWAR